MRHVSVQIRNLQNWQQPPAFMAMNSSYSGVDVLTVTIEEGSRRGIGHAVANPAMGETPDSVLAEAKAMRGALESYICEDQHQLLSLLPAGGARHAIDLAFWDLQTGFNTNRFWPQPGKTRRLVRRFDDLASLPDQEQDERVINSKATSFRWYSNSPEHLPRLITLWKLKPHARWLLEFGPAVSLADVGRVGKSIDPARIIALGMASEHWDSQLYLGLGEIPRCFNGTDGSPENLTLMASHFQYMLLDLAQCGGLTYCISRIRAAERAGLKTVLCNSWYSAFTPTSAAVLGKLAHWVASTPTELERCLSAEKACSSAEELSFSSVAE